MSSKVYFSSARTSYGNNLTDKLKLLFEQCGAPSTIKSGDLTAIKMHWGEAGNLAYAPPPMIRAIVECIRKAGGNPFLTDANTLYRGSRGNAVDNLRTAIENGFSFATVGAPVIIADGLRGDDYVRVEVNGDHFKRVKIASGIHYAQSMIVFSHFKGHEATGFGGALKNVGMGCAAPSGKQNQHSDVKPKVKEKRCIACGSCISKCPANAIGFTPEKKASINHDVCIGCAECTIVCPTEAIGVNWKTDLRLLQEKMAEYSKGVLAHKEGRCAFFNLITRVTPDCDCCNWSDAPIVPDIGIAASLDPVALDQACVDLVNDAPGISASRLGSRAGEKDKFRALHEVDWAHQLDHAVKMGVGSREYELITVEKE